jgi:hypothetical protein
MYCAKCGNRASEGDRFCASCGVPLAVVVGAGASPRAVPISNTAVPAPETVNPAANEAAWPWARLLARLLDIQINASVVAIALGLISPSLFQSIDRAASGNAIVWGFFLLPIALLVDAAVMAAFGTTLGKVAAGVRVEYREGRLSLAQCLTRNIDVYVRGLAFGLPVVNLFTMALAARRLRQGRLTVWDESGSYRVWGVRLRWYRWLVLLVVWLCFTVAGAVLNMLDRPARTQTSFSVMPQSRSTTIEGIALGDKLADVYFKHGQFDLMPSDVRTKRVNSEDETYNQKDGQLTITVRKGAVVSILYKCKEFDAKELRGVSCGDAGETLEARFPGAVRVLCHVNEDEYSRFVRVYDVIRHGARFYLSKNKVIGIAVWDPVELESLVGINWDACK